MCSSYPHEWNLFRLNNHQEKCGLKAKIVLVRNFIQVEMIHRTEWRRCSTSIFISVPGGVFNTPVIWICISLWMCIWKKNPSAFHFLPPFLLHILHDTPTPTGWHECPHLLWLCGNALTRILKVWGSLLVSGYQLWHCSASAQKGNLCSCSSIHTQSLDNLMENC